MYFSQFIGVDISKDTLDAAIYPAKDKKLDFLHFDNTQKGLGEMMTWLKRRGVKLAEMVICAEHTGVYTNPLIAFADKKGLALSLNSPLDIKRSMGIARGKNDAVDAGRIAEYAHNHLAVGTGDAVALRVGGLDDELQVGHIGGDAGQG